MKQKIRFRGLVLGRHKGGVVKCADCQRILGYLHEEPLDYAYLHLLCHCGAGGYLELGEKNEDPTTALADAVCGELACPECKAVWFTQTEGTRGFAFRFVCRCQTVAEKSYESKRKMYQELDFCKN